MFCKLGLIFLTVWGLGRGIRFPPPSPNTVPIPGLLVKVPLSLTQKDKPEGDDSYALTGETQPSLNYDRWFSGNPWLRSFQPAQSNAQAEALGAFERIANPFQGPVATPAPDAPVEQPRQWLPTKSVVFVNPGADQQAFYRLLPIRVYQLPNQTISDGRRTPWIRQPLPPNVLSTQPLTNVFLLPQTSGPLRKPQVTVPRFRTGRNTNLAPRPKSILLPITAFRGWKDQQETQMQRWTPSIPTVGKLSPQISVRYKGANIPAVSVPKGVTAITHPPGRPDVPAGYTLANTWIFRRDSAIPSFQSVRTILPKAPGYVPQPDPSIYARRKYFAPRTLPPIKVYSGDLNNPRSKSTVIVPDANPLPHSPQSDVLLFGKGITAAHLAPLKDPVLPPERNINGKSYVVPNVWPNPWNYPKSSGAVILKSSRDLSNDEVTGASSPYSYFVWNPDKRNVYYLSQLKNQVPILPQRIRTPPLILPSTIKNNAIGYGRPFPFQRPTIIGNQGFAGIIPRVIPPMPPVPNVSQETEETTPTSVLSEPPPVADGGAEPELITVSTPTENSIESESSVERSENLPEPSDLNPTFQNRYVVSFVQPRSGRHFEYRFDNLPSNTFNYEYREEVGPNHNTQSRSSSVNYADGNTEQKTSNYPSTRQDGP